MSFGSGGYQGLGVYSGGPPQPPPRRGLKIILSVLVVLLLGGGAVAAVLLFGADDAPQARGGASTPQQAKAPARDGWQTVVNNEAGVRYQVPPSWDVLSDYTKASIGSLDGGGVAQVYPFQCEDRSLVRGNIVSARVDDGSSDPADAAAALALSSYRIGDDLPEVGPPVSVQAGGGATAATVTVRSSGKNRCYATQAKITGVSVPVSDGTAIVVLNVPLDGPNAEYSPNEEQVRGILDSVTPVNNAQN